MPRPHPPEFRQRAVELARAGDKPISQLAKDLGISESCLRGWLARADIDAGAKPGLTSDERAELVRLRREKRVLETENEILRRAVGWSIADHLRAELVVDALEMARLRRRPEGTTVHSDHGSQYTSWVFGQRLRAAGLFGSMGTVGDALDNAVAESFFASLQCELLDRHHWPTRAGLARAMFHWIEAFYNPTRRHSTLGYLSPIDYEQTAATQVA